MIWMDVDTALSEVPVNVVPLTDDTDFKTIETGVAYNASGMALYWHFVTTAGAYTVTAVTPTTAGTYDWTHQQQGMYTIEIPASGGASINNDTEGYGWFTGFATGVLPWRGPTIGFRAAALNNALVDGGDVLDVSLTEIGGDAQSATDLKDFADAGYDPSTNKVQGVVLTDTVTTYTGNTPQTGDAYARLGAPAGASVSADVAAVKSDTAAILDDTGTNGVVVAAGSKTGYSLTAGTGLGNQTADITGTITTVTNLTTNNDKTGYSLASGGVGSGAIAAAELNTIADAILDRNMTTGTDSGSPTVRTVRQALRVMRNKVSIAAGTATIYKEDDSTASWTAAVTTTAGDPISAVDPA